MSEGKTLVNKELMKMDLYGLLGITAEASDKEIKKAYRRKSRTCHPDKNPDNPQAAELFHQLSQVLEILTNGAARDEYDKLRKAKAAVVKRKREMDDERKKFQLELEAQEKAEQAKQKESHDARMLEQEIIRLREESAREMEELRLKQRMGMEKMQGNRAGNTEKEEGPAKIKIKWKCKKEDETRGGYTEDVLKKRLQLYGQVLHLVCSKSKGSAIAEFATVKAADLAVKYEVGLLNNPLKVSWIGSPPPNVVSQNPSKTSSDCSSSQNSLRSEKDFESVVLMRMRQAAERQRLIEQLQHEDEEANT